MTELYFFISVFLVNVQQRIVTGSGDNGVCTKGYFPCENDTICIKQENNCDGTVDCPNGSDEMQCDDSDQDSYWDHIFKKRLAAENDDVDKYCNLTYNGTCVCRARELLCGHKKFDKIPEDLPQESITLLDFEANNFRILSREFLKGIPQHVDKLEKNIQFGSGKLKPALPLIHHCRKGRNVRRTIPV